MDLLAAFHTFVRVAETGSFTAVAREAGLTQPAVSRQVAALEAHFGARLVQRTTRSVALTEDGRDLLGHARAVLEAVERAEGAVGRRQGGVSGMVRLSAPVVFGRVVIAPRIHSLLERHPGLSIDLMLDDRPMDLVHEGVDVAVRVGELPPDASFVARRIGTFSRLIVGSAAYLARHPEPLHPADLARHQCILFDRAARPGVWTLSGPGGSMDVAVEGRFHTDSPEAGREAVLTGLGLAVLSAWLIRRELRDGTVRPVLQDWKLPLVPVHAVDPTQRNLAPRTRALIDFLVQEFRADPELFEM